MIVRRHSVLIAGASEASLESFREPRNTVGIVRRGRLFPAARHRRATPSSAGNDWLHRAAFRAPLSRYAHISRSAFIRWPLDSYMSCDELLQLQPAPDDDLESLSEAGSETHAWSSEYRPDLFIPVARSNFWRFVSAKPRFQNTESASFRTDRKASLLLFCVTQPGLQEPLNVVPTQGLGHQ
jgi:hypothetical protein